MEAQPWTEKLRDQVFTGSAVVGGVHMHICVFCLNKQKQQEGGGGQSEQ